MRTVLKELVTSESEQNFFFRNHVSVFLSLIFDNLSRHYLFISGLVPPLTFFEIPTIQNALNNPWWVDVPLHKNAVYLPDVYCSCATLEFLLRKLVNCINSVISHNNLLCSITSMWAKFSRYRCSTAGNHLLLYTHMQMHVEHNDDTIKTSGHTSFEKYTSHFIGRVVCERWVGDWTKTATYWPHNSSVYHSLSFPFSWAAQPGHNSHSSIFSLTDLNFLSPGLIIIWRPPTSCERHNFALNSTPRQSRSPLISWYLRLNAPVIFTGEFILLTAWPGRRSICNTLSLILGWNRHSFPRNIIQFTTALQLYLKKNSRGLFRLKVRNWRNDIEERGKLTN